MLPTTPAPGAPSGSGPGCDAAAMRAAWGRLYDDVPTVVDPPETRRLLERFRMISWGAANSGDMDEFASAQAAARRAAEIRAGGATVALVRGRHFRLDWLGENARLLCYYRTAAAACRAAGLACFAHLDLTLAWQPGFRLLRQNPEWPQRSLRDGTPTRWLCCNHPGLREFYACHVEEIARQGILGFMLDEIAFASRDDFHCGCEHCRAAFERKTGCRFPEHFDPEVIGNRAHPLWRLWQEWQMQALTGFRLFLLERLRRIDPRIVILVYSTNIEAPNESGSDTFENARICYAGTEGSDLTYARCVNLYAQQRISLANSRFFGRPAWAQYPVGNEQERQFACLGLAPVTGNGPWNWPDATARAQFDQAQCWAHLEELLVPAEPMADLGIVWSSSNRYQPEGRATLSCAEACGWIQALGLRGIQFNPVPAKYARIEHLRPYCALIVPDSPLLPQDAIDAIRRHVAGGATALLTGTPGLRDVLHFPLGDEALATAIGLERITPAGAPGFDRKKRAFLGAADHSIVCEPGFLPGLPRRLTVPAGYRFDFVVRSGVPHEILARFTDGRPAACSIRSGKGRYVYVGLTPGQAAFEPLRSQQTIVTRHHPPQVLDLMRALALEATGGSDRILVDGEGILSSTWRHGRRVWVRMANIAGARRLAEGRPVGKVQPEYPALGPIRVRVRLPLAVDPLLLSAESEKPLPLRTVTAGPARVLEIAPAGFRISAFLRLEVAP